MLFNSHEFILFFMPVVFCGYFWLGSTRYSDLANIWIAFASLFFYGCWNIRFLPLLLASITVNYLFSLGILHARECGQIQKKKWLFIGSICFNLGLLCYYKYLAFFLSLLGIHVEQQPIPLGISFFTFTQLLYLLDCHSGTVKKHKVSDYALFVSFFPHLMAGPILYHKTMMVQFDNKELRRINWDNLSRGFCLFIIGLGKKILIADAFIPCVAWGFDNVGALSQQAAWLLTICFLMQLYFDFSGYSDMAVGLARMMNIDIPINFNAPLRATSIANFWQRWHISLTKALTACVFTPIVRAFKSVTFGHAVFAAFVTFFLCGLWHGASMTFVVLSLVQGIAVVINMAWRHKKLPMPKWLGHTLTLLTILVFMVFFRANNVHDALHVLSTMYSFQFTDAPLAMLPKYTLFISLLLVTFSPTSNEIVERIKPNVWMAAAFALVFCLSFANLTKVSTFLYFQF